MVVTGTAPPTGEAALGFLTVEARCAIAAPVRAPDDDAPLVFEDCWGEDAEGFELERGRLLAIAPLAANKDRSPAEPSGTVVSA